MVKKKFTQGRSLDDLKVYVSENKDISIRNQCKLLNINRSSLYYNAKQESQENLEIMRLLDQHYLENPTYGVLQMQDYLGGLNMKVNHKRVRRLLRKMGIMAIFPKRNFCTLSGIQEKISHQSSGCISPEIGTGIPLKLQKKSLSHADYPLRISVDWGRTGILLYNMKH